MELTGLKRMLLGATAELKKNKQKLNDLNVFPIPDGDTGNNMHKTLMGGIAVISELCKDDAGREITDEDIDAIYEGILMASQGNSGVILSQWMKGFLFCLKNDIEDFDFLGFNDAFRNGVSAAYNAVASPVEGTFLTVAREAQENTEEEIEEEITIAEYLEIAIKHATVSLNHTPELLPVLKEAGVVDSGAYGFVCILNGMRSALSDEQADYSEILTVNTKVTTEKEDEFGYCTELILKLEPERSKNFQMKGLIDFLNYKGNSVVAVKDGDKVKLHVHTLEPEAVIKYCHQFGEFLKLKIENMTLQHQRIVSDEHKRVALVAVADGEGTAELFRDLGADYIISGGQSDNVSTGDFVNVIKEADADHIVLIPNNSNIVMVAQQVAELEEEKDVRVLVTRSMAEGYAALAAFDKEEDADNAFAHAKKAVKHTVSALICQANRDATTDGVEVKEGEFLGMIDKNIVTSKPSPEEAIYETLGNVSDWSKKETMLVLCKDELAMSRFVTKKEKLAGITGDIATTVLCGGQQIYDYVIAIQ